MTNQQDQYCEKSTHEWLCESLRTLINALRECAVHLRQEVSQPRLYNILIDMKKRQANCLLEDGEPVKIMIKHQLNTEQALKDCFIVFADILSQIVLKCERFFVDYQRVFDDKMLKGSDQEASKSVKDLLMKADTYLRNHEMPMLADILKEIASENFNLVYVATDRNAIGQYISCVTEEAKSVLRNYLPDELKVRFENGEDISLELLQQVWQPELVKLLRCLNQDEMAVHELLGTCLCVAIQSIRKKNAQFLRLVPGKILSYVSDESESFRNFEPDMWYVFLGQGLLQLYDIFSGPGGLLEELHHPVLGFGSPKYSLRTMVIEIFKSFYRWAGSLFGRLSVVVNALVLAPLARLLRVVSGYASGSLNLDNKPNAEVESGDFGERCVKAQEPHNACGNPSSGPKPVM